MLAVNQKVDEKTQRLMNTFISRHGIYAFRDAVCYGSFAECKMAYLHPTPELRESRGFIQIREAFINTLDT